jgi:hypothetical protein
MRLIGVFILAITLLASGAAHAGMAKKCRKACKPAIAACVANRQTTRTCKRSILPVCKRNGLAICSTTPTTLDGPTTTTTTLPGTGDGGGVMSLEVNDATATGDVDPRTFTIEITIGYSIVTANAATSVPLDPAYFSVVDEDTNVVYPAEPALERGDCSALLIAMLDGPDVSCTLRFTMPFSVGDYGQQGGVHSKVTFLASGLHGEDDFSL